MSLNSLTTENRCCRQAESDSAVCFPEQQDSMATTVAVSPSEYLQPSTASTQVSNSQMSCPATVYFLVVLLLFLLTLSYSLSHDAFNSTL